jgi:hypothetical protein
MLELYQKAAKNLPDFKPELCQKHRRIYIRSLPEICQDYQRHAKHNNLAAYYFLIKYFLLTLLQRWQVGRTGGQIGIARDTGLAKAVAVVVGQHGAAGKIGQRAAAARERATI